MALFMCRDVIVSGQGYVGVPGTIWGGSRTCSTGDNTSLGHQPITTEMTQATPCCPGLLTSEREEERRKIDRLYKRVWVCCRKALRSGATLACLRLLIAPYRCRDGVTCKHWNPNTNVCLLSCLLIAPPSTCFHFCTTVLSYYEEKQNEQSIGGLWYRVMTDCCALLGCTASTCSKLKPVQISLAEGWEGLRCAADSYKRSLPKEIINLLLIASHQ